jgi:predicted phage tail protein
VGASSGILTGVVTAAKVGTFGAMMALSGIAQLISPTPQMGNYGQLESPAQRTSFLYNGPTNTTQQGGPIPILYGLMRVGSTLVSATVTTEDTNNPAAVNPIPGVSLETIFDGSKG